MGNCCGGCFWLQEDEQLLLTDPRRGRSVKNGPGTVYSAPFVDAEKRRAVLLDQTQYIHLKDKLSGVLSIQKGPQTYFLKPYEEQIQLLSVITLGKNEWVRIRDTLTGEQRIERGEAKIYLGPVDKELNRGKAWLIDEHHSVMVRDEATAELRLVNQDGLFFPGPYETVIQEQKKILLEDFEVVVLKNNKGEFKIFRGDSSETRSFFVPPYHEILEMNWANPFVLSRVAVNKTMPPERIQVWKFDLRPRFMNYEFIARTVDNVELDIAITFFWRIIDVNSMIHQTADLPGDICTHARSVIIQNIANVQLMDFLQHFNEIVVKTILDGKDKFYLERGAELINVEVMRFSCVDKETDKTLQEIIQETTERIKALEKQRSQNEVAQARVQGEIIEEREKAKKSLEVIAAEIEQEKEKARLIDLRKDHHRREAKIEGQAEAEKILEFIKTLGTDVKQETKMDLLLMLRKLQAIEAVSGGNASLYYTPNDVNLSIETLMVPPKNRVDHK